MLDTRSAAFAGNVSIRTPVKGVMNKIQAQAKVYQGFNPHPREGGDTITTSCTCYGGGFNPHPREGGDAPTYLAMASLLRVSIRTPVKGVIW